MKLLKLLYDKSFPGYKGRHQHKNAWKPVDEEIGLEEGIYC